MNFDPLWLFLSLIPSGIGFVLLVYGRKQHRVPHIVAGVLLMVYPYWATTVTGLLIVGGVIGGGWWWATRVGW